MGQSATPAIGIDPRLHAAMEKMGYGELRHGQQEIIEKVMAGQDVLGIMPTGGGKSALYILPSLALGSQCLVISPLISLQKDQVDKLVAKGVAAAAINSMVGWGDNRDTMSRWLDGSLQFLFIAPERLDAGGFTDQLCHRRPGLVVIDEVHCVAKWAIHFRPAYRLIAPLLARIRPVPVLALTATLTETDEQDVREILQMKAADRRTYFYRRENLQFKTHNSDSITDIIETVDRINGPVIVYSATIRRIEEELHPGLSEGLGERQVIMYHGKMEPDIRKAAQEQFMGSRNAVVVATNAFGMGIDKADIRGVIHAEMPSSIEAYAQETGRAGRDGKPSQCVLFVNRGGIQVQEWFFLNANPPKRDYRYLWDYLLRLSDHGRREINMGIDELSLQVRMKSQTVQSIISVCTGAGLLLRGDQSYQHRITPLSAPSASVPPMIANAYRRLISVMMPCDREIVQAPKALAEILNIKSVRAMDDALEALARSGCIDFVPARRNKTIRVAKTELALDWKALARKAARESKAMNAMITFAMVPDDQKHAVMEVYFEKGEVPEGSYDLGGVPLIHVDRYED